MPDTDIKFIGYQEVPDGAAFPLFNMLNEHHPLYGSTITPETIVREGFLVPDHPTFGEWRQIQRAAMDLYAACKLVLSCQSMTELMKAQLVAHTAIEKVEWK